MFEHTYLGNGIAYCFGLHRDKGEVKRHTWNKSINAFIINGKTSVANPTIDGRKARAYNKRHVDTMRYGL